MNLFHGVGEFFSLDIGTNSIKLVQLFGSVQHGWSLLRYAYVPVSEQIIQDNSELGKGKFGEVLKKAVEDAGIKTKNVVVGLPASKTFTSIIDFPLQNEKNMMNNVKYQLDEYVPMPMDEAKVDYVNLGVSPKDPSMAEILVSSTANSFVEDILDLIEGVGLNVVAFEPEPIAMARALMPVGATDAQLIVDFGMKAADIVVVYKGAPRLVRSIPGGFENLVKTVASSISINEDQARQFILKFGLEQDKADGQVFRALDSVLEGFTTELKKSAEFFQSNYAGAKVGGIVLSGFGQTIPFMGEYVEAKIGIHTSLGNPWQLVRVSSAQQQALLNVASEFAVAIGLAERSNA